MNFTQFIVELNNWDSHPDISGNPEMQRKAAQQQARRKGAGAAKPSVIKSTNAIQGSAAKTALPSGGGALAKSPPKPSALVKTPKPPTPPKLPKPRPQIKLPKPGPMRIDPPKKHLSSPPTDSEEPETTDTPEEEDKKKKKGKENFLLHKLKSKAKKALLSGPGEVGVAMGRDLPGAPQRNRGI